MQRDTRSTCTAHLLQGVCLSKLRCIHTKPSVCLAGGTSVRVVFWVAPQGSFSPDSGGWLSEMEVSQDWFLRPPALACGWPSSPMPSYGRLAVHVWVLISSYLTSRPRLGPTLKVSFHSISKHGQHPEVLGSGHQHINCRGYSSAQDRTVFKREKHSNKLYILFSPCQNLAFHIWSKVLKSLFLGLQYIR